MNPVFSSWPSLSLLLAAGAGGALGTVLRVGLSWKLEFWLGEGFPWGTLVANVSGGLAIGVLAGLFGTDFNWRQMPMIYALLAAGLLGGLTTFSSFALEFLRLWQKAAWLAGAYMVCSVLLTILAVWGGRAFASAVRLG